MAFWRRSGAVLLALLCLLQVFGAVLSIAEEEEAPPPDFEALLEEEGFPESYREALRALHEQYPSWVFRAQHIPLTWDEVLKAESAVGVSLVHTNSIASWKSCEPGAFDPATGRWYGLDGAAWVAADQSVVAHFLDPRNALNEQAIFQFENLAYSDVCTADGVRAILAGTFMAGDEYVNMFMEAGKEAGVSPYHLASRARQEQGVNGNALGKGYVIGDNTYYNFFNINAYATSTLTAIENGARYAATVNSAYHLPWTSPALSIKGGAVILGNSYIRREQNTLYLQKFDVTDGGNGYFQHQYMTNIQAPTSEAITLSAAYSDEVKAGAMEFCIPVYEDMPEEACQKPISTGRNHNWLRTLSVAGQTLTPTFTMYTTAYELVMAPEVTSITVEAIPDDAAATVSGTGMIPLKSGMNTVEITVTAASGAKRVYTLSVYRTPGEGDDAELPAPTLTTDYRLESDIRGVAPGTTVEAFLSAFTLEGEGASLALVDGKGQPATGLVGSGHTLQVIVGDGLYAAYPIIIRGDVSGDGAINSLDLLRMQKQILSIAALSEPLLAAADVNGDGAVNALDLLRTQKHILKLTVIEQ